MKMRFLHIFFVLFVWYSLNNSFAQVIPGDSLKAKVTDTTFKVRPPNPKADAIISYAKSFLGVPCLLYTSDAADEMD
jgi:hypothetical protein